MSSRLFSALPVVALLFTPLANAQGVAPGPTPTPTPVAVPTRTENVVVQAIRGD